MTVILGPRLFPVLSWVKLIFFSPTVWWQQTVLYFGVHVLVLVSVML